MSLRPATHFSTWEVLLSIKTDKATKSAVSHYEKVMEGAFDLEYKDSRAKREVVVFEHQ